MALPPVCAHTQCRPIAAAADHSIKPCTLVEARRYSIYILVGWAGVLHREATEIFFLAYSYNPASKLMLDSKGHLLDLWSSAIHRSLVIRLDLYA